MASMTYTDGLNILHSALNSTRGILKYPYHFLYIAHAYSQGWLEDNHTFPNWKKLVSNLEEYDPIHNDYDVDPVVNPLSNLRSFIGSDNGYREIAFLIPEYNRIIDSYSDAPGAFLATYRILDTIPLSWWNENWSTAFDHIVSYINQSDGMDMGLYTQPDELTTLVLFLDLILSDIGHTTYDPFAGIGQFLSRGSFGGEIDDQIYTLGRLRMLAKGYTIDEASNYIRTDSIENWGKIYCEQQKFDTILSYPPLGSRIPVPHSMLNEWNSKYIDIDEFFIVNGLRSLKPGGHLIGIFTTSFLFSNGNKGKLRERLVKEKKIQMVIQLPANLFSYASVPTCVVVFAEDPKSFKETLLIDASSLFTKEKRRNRLDIVSVEGLILDLLGFSDPKYISSSFSLIKEKQPRTISQDDAPHYAINVPFDVILSKDCILIPTRYVNNLNISVPEGFELVQLKDIVTFYRGQSAKNANLRLIRGRDLSDGKDIEYSSFEELNPEMVSTSVNILQHDCILLQKIGNLKPTLYRKDDNVPVAIPSTIIALIPNDGIDPYYLVSELVKPYVVEQVERSFLGVISSIRQDDLQKIQILLPTERNLQHTFFLNSQRKEVDEYIQRERDRINEMMKIRAHRFRQYISGSKNYISMLMEELNTTGKLEPDTIIEGFNNVSDVFENIYANLADLGDLIDKLNIDTNVGLAESINIVSFLNDYNYVPKNASVHFVIDKTQLETLDSKPIISFNGENLQEALDQIVHNAEKHFKQDEPDNRLALILRENGQNTSLLICNNGEPVPDDFDEERSFKPGYSKDKGGTGIGLYRVRQLCDEFGAKVKWENDPSNLMPTGLCITFKTLDN